MGDDNRAVIEVDGNLRPLRNQLRAAGADLKRFASEGEQSLGKMTKPLAAVQSRFLAVGALLAGGAVFKESVAAAAEHTEESIKLGRAMGMNASEASVLREALIAGNTSQEEFVAAGKGLAKQLKTNEGSLQAMGLKTRDAAGNLRPLNELVLEGIGVVNSYRAGTDRAVAGQALFGKGFEMTSSLAEMNSAAVEETRVKMEALGLVVGEEATKAWQDFDNAGDDVALTLKGMKVTIGAALMPVLTQLSQWFAVVGPYAIVGIKGAIGGLISLFWGLKLAVVTIFEVLRTTLVNTFVIPLAGISEAIKKVLDGDFAGAAREFNNIRETRKQNWDDTFSRIVDQASETRDKMYDLFAKSSTPGASPIAGSKGADDLLKEGKEKKDPSKMAEYEAELAAEKNKYEQENILRQYSKEQELAFWQLRLQSAEKGSQDWLAISRKTATLDLEIRRENAKNQRDLDQAEIEHRKLVATTQLDADEQAARLQRERSGRTVAQQLAQDRAFAKRRYDIERQALDERMALMQKDPAMSAAARMQLQDQVLQVDAQYAARMRDIQGRAAAESGRIWESFTDSISNLWDQGIQAMLNGTLTWRGAMNAIFTQMVSWFVTDVIGAQVKAWLASKATMLAAELGFTSTKQGIEVAASGTTVATKEVETGAVVGMEAAKAGAGAAASVAPIPIIGPALALAAMATVFAAVMALKSRKSAMGGYDIPRGLNPVVQTHEEEMILPKKYANVIRDMASGGASSGGGSGDGPMSITIKALDARSVRDYLQQNAHALAPALRRLKRNGVTNG